MLVLLVKGNLDHSTAAYFCLVSSLLELAGEEMGGGVIQLEIIRTALRGWWGLGDNHICLG